MADGVKIQINSLAALERLIGGDNEIEFDIRQNIAKAFAKKYIKNILDEESMRAVGYTTIKEFEELFTSHDENSPHFYLNKSRRFLNTFFQNNIKKHVEAATDALIEQAIKEHISQLMSSGTINELIKNRVEYIKNIWTGDFIEREITKRAKELINTKLST